MKTDLYPKGYHAINPILRVDDVTRALEYYKHAFGATEDFRRELGGRMQLVVIKLGDSRVMLVDRKNEPRRTAGGDPRGNGLMLKLYVENADQTFARALQTGAREETPIEDQYFGERSGMLTDPFGFSWQIAEYKEEVPHDIIEQRMRKTQERS
ncbi:MAG TPA: VOC family protein [Steroidobacteraceae bacterium]|nr:VOC family protein [Steroidobacteraceae bacterium]